MWQIEKLLNRSNVSFCYNDFTKSVDVVHKWKHCDERRNCSVLAISPFASMISLVRQSKCVCRWERVTDLSRTERKPTLWTMRKVSILISLNIPRRLTRTNSFRLLLIFCFRNHYSIPETDCVGPDQSARTVQADLVDTLRRGHTVCFLAGRLICFFSLPLF